MKRRAILVILLALLTVTVGGQVAPGIDAARLAQIDDLIIRDIADKKLPGAVVVVGHKGKIVYRKAFGNRALVPAPEPMTVDTVFDAASLTKPVATATSIMILVERGSLRLSDTVGRFIPEIEDESARRITVLQLLTHTSGYAPDFDLKEKWSGRDGMLSALYKERLRSAPGTRFVYSDIGFIVLGEIIRRVSSMSEDRFAAANVFDPLKMADSSFRIIDRSRPDPARNSVYCIREFTPLKPGVRPPALPPICRVAPTENVRGQQNYLGSVFEGDEKTGDRILLGEVHDPTAHRMNGVAGHAGMFTTADDLAKYAQMMLSGGSLGGKRILAAQSVARMTAPYVVSESGDARGLGWDMNTSFSTNRGELFPLGSFGHTGFTGTGIWIDRDSQTFVVFMSNRVHPDGKGDVGPLRAKVSTVVASAIRDADIGGIARAEAEFNARIAPQIERFRQTVVRQAVQAPGRKVQKVLNGIDVLEKEGFKRLEGLRIGLVTNQTGRNFAGKPTIDVLFEAKNVRLTALFSPEHGIRGELDQEKIDDTKDEKTGLPVYSLYGETRRPKPEQLRDLDALVYDIQDIGARFYTYTATLRNVMEEAAKAGKPVFVLDRPNPLGGIEVEGPLADGDKLSFIAAHTIPVRYGLTIGELGTMMNEERKIGADLRVVKMENWSRSQWFDETSQTWINPSPNMRSLTQATLYPGIGLLEFTNLSVGRGTDTPFEVVGAPWIDGQRLASFLNERRLPGVAFVPVRYKPRASVFKDENCGGINIVITDRARFRSVRTGLEIAVALRKLYPQEWQIERYDRLLVNRQIFEMVKLGDEAERIERAWAELLAEFGRRRARFLLYN